jgi:hypothetical protein
MSINGIYKLIEPNKYQSQNGTGLIVSKRKNAKAGMSSHYLLMVDANGNRDYLSSLYLVSPGIFNIEVNRNRYRVTITNDELVINCAKQTQTQ